MVRQATVDDTEPLARLYKELMDYHHKLAPEKYEEFTDEKCLKKIKMFIESSESEHPFYRVILHETDGAIDGLAVYVLMNVGCSEEKRDGLLVVENLIVDERTRRKGIGTELLRELFDIAENGFCKSVSIDFYKDNTGARKFYEKMGLIPTTIHMEKRI